MKYASFVTALLFAGVEAGTEKTLEPTPQITRPGPNPTPAPTECICEDLGYLVIGGVCSRGCSLNDDGEFDSVEECCASIGFTDEETLPGCPVDDECGTPFPTRSPITPFPTENTPEPTPAPTLCNCEELGYVVIDGVCSRGCSLDEDGEFDSVEECCASIGFGGGSLSSCPVNDECGTPFPTPEPTPAPTGCDCEELDFVVVDGVCSRGCSVDADGEFDDAEECCASIGFVDDDAFLACPVFDECPPPTPAPTPCDCGELNFVVIDGVCSRGCSIDQDGEFDSVEECCASIGFEGAMMLPSCLVFDECPPTPVDPCSTSTSKSGKSGGSKSGYYYSGDMSMGFIDCFTSSSSKSGKSGSKGGKSGGYGHKGGKSGGSGHKGGKSGGGGSSDGHSGYGYHVSNASRSGKGGKSGGGHKGGKSGGSNSGSSDGYGYGAPTGPTIPNLIEPNIVQIARANDDFSLLVQAVEAAGLADALSGDGPFTVFAPTNIAFEALGRDTLAAVLADPDQLADILLYHVVSGKVKSLDIMTGPVPTLNGADINIFVGGDGSITVNDAAVIAADIETSNGVIHVIDAVLLPPVGARRTQEARTNLRAAADGADRI